MCINKSVERVRVFSLSVRQQRSEHDKMLYLVTDRGLIQKQMFMQADSAHSDARRCGTAHPSQQDPPDRVSRSPDWLR